jgi:hypothetical protein
MITGARTATTLPRQGRDEFRERWALARHLYETNSHLFEDELDAMTALGLAPSLDTAPIRLAR